MYEKLAGVLPELQFDWVAYYRIIRNDILAQNISDRNGNKEIDKFWRALGQERWSLRCRVCADLVYRDLRKRVNLARFRKVITGGPPPLWTTRGEEYGFRDIFECSQALDAISGVAQRQNTKKLSV
jgi:hypothetical protein